VSQNAGSPQHAPRNSSNTAARSTGANNIADEQDRVQGPSVGEPQEGATGSSSVHTPPDAISIAYLHLAKLKRIGTACRVVEVLTASRPGYCEASSLAKTKREVQILGLAVPCERFIEHHRRRRLCPKHHGAAR
jgi:hypothetical protein